MINRTVKYWLSKKNSTVEYKYIQDPNKLNNGNRDECSAVESVDS